MQKLESQLASLQYASLSLSKCHVLSTYNLAGKVDSALHLCNYRLISQQLSCRAAKTHDDEQLQACKQACRKAEETYSAARINMQGSDDFVQAQQGLQACRTQRLQVEPACPVPHQALPVGMCGRCVSFHQSQLMLAAALLGRGTQQADALRPEAGGDCRLRPSGSEQSRSSRGRRPINLPC